MTLDPRLVAKALTVLAAGLTSAVAAGLIVGPTAAWVTIAVTAITTVAVYLMPPPVVRTAKGAPQPPTPEGPAPVVVPAVPQAVTPPV